MPLDSTAEYQYVYTCAYCSTQALCFHLASLLRSSLVSELGELTLIVEVQYGLHWNLESNHVHHEPIGLITGLPRYHKLHMQFKEFYPEFCPV